MEQSLESSRIPSLRWRLLIIVSIASLLILILASSLSYRRARHEVQELLDDQMAKVGQLMLAQVQDGKNHLSGLPDRISGIRGLRPRNNSLTLEFQISNTDGTILSRSSKAPKAPLDGKLGYSTITVDGHLWRSLILEAVDRSFRIQIVESIPKRDKEALEIAAKTVQPLILILPLLLLAIYFSVRAGLKPLDRLASEIATRSSDNLTPIGGRSIPREAQPLVAAINRVLFRLGFSLESERRFTADAAHELRTPLAAARIQAQVALLSTDDDKRRHALTQTIAGLDRSTRLVEQMLRLARLDPLARLPQTEKVSLADLAERVVAGLRDAFPQARLVLDLVNIELFVEGDPDLLEVALRNLIDNAIRYSPKQSDVIVFLSSAGSATALGVRDNGPGVASEELPRLKERFYRGTSVVAEGSGLGLTIVSRIAQLHSADLVLANRENGGFEAWLQWASAQGR